MKNCVLMTLPNWDDVTTYLSIFSKDIEEECVNKQISIKSLKQNQVTKQNVEKAIKNLDYKMIIFNGHGNSKAIMGHKNEELIIIHKNHNLLKDRITYSRSCWSTMELGRECMKQSSQGCFIGYQIPFMFVIDTNWISNPIKDTTAKVFFDTSNLVPLGIIKGHTAGESHENARKSMLKAIKKSVLSGNAGIAQTLWNNYVGQEIVGNSEEKLL